MTHLNALQSSAHRAADQYHALLASPWPSFIEQLKSKGVFVSEARVKTQIIRENFNQIYDGSSLMPPYNCTFAINRLNAMYIALKRIFELEGGARRREFAKRLLGLAEKTLAMQVSFSEEERNEFCFKVGALMLIIEMIIRSPLCSESD